MRTAARIITITAMIAVALSLGAVMAAEPVFDARALRFELVDGTVITGRIDVKLITIRIKPHTIDPGSTQMVIEYPTGLRILPVDLTFKHIPIRDIQERLER